MRARVRTVTFIAPGARLVRLVRLVRLGRLARLGRLGLMLAVAAGLAACGAGSATDRGPQPAAPTVELDPALDRTLTAFIESLGGDGGEARAFSGIVLVAKGDRVLYERGFGYANRATKAPITGETSFRIGSVTKQFTAAAILTLAARGALSVDDPIRKHLPDYPQPGAAVTIHELLSHTSGIPSYTDDPAVMEARDRPLTVAQLLATFRDKPLVFPPGTDWQYSNSNYAVLGAIIERVTGAPYARFMRDAIFAPAGLARTVVGDAEQLSDRALGYEPAGDALVEAPRIDMSVPFAAGAVRSTARDLWRWARALDSDRVLTGALRDKLYAPVKRHYAYGWMVAELEGQQVVMHGGGIDGFVSSFVRVPATGVIVVVLSNTMRGRPEEIARAAVAAVAGKPVQPLDERRAALDPAIGRRIAGRYQLPAAGRELLAAKGLPASAIATIETVDIRPGTTSVELKPAGQPPVELEAAADGSFVMRALGIKVTFELDATDAPAPRLKLEQRGLALDYDRE